MKTKIVYFEDPGHSWTGTKRGAVAALVLSINIVVYGKRLTFMPVCVIIMLILIASAIAVQNPSTLKEAVVYGGLVGLVTFGTLNMGLLMAGSGWTTKDATIAIIAGVMSAALASAAIFPITYN